MKEGKVPTLGHHRPQSLLLRLNWLEASISALNPLCSLGKGLAVLTSPFLREGRKIGDM